MQLQLVSTIVIIHSQDKFLLVQRALDDDIFPGKWQSAGGKIEFGETLEAAAAREIKEETGIEITDNLQFVMSYSWQKSPQDPWRLGIVLLVDMPMAQSEKVVVDAELADYGWYSLEEAANLETIGKGKLDGTYAQLEKAHSIIAQRAST